MFFNRLVESCVNTIKKDLQICFLVGISRVVNNSLQVLITFRKGYKTMDNKYFSKKLTTIKNNQKRTREVIQDYLHDFVESYDNDLNKNSTPLFNLIEVLTQGDRYLVGKWLIKYTTCKSVSYNNKKTGINLKIEGDSLAFVGGVVGNWWEYDKPKTEEKPYLISDFEKSAKSLFKKVADKNLSVNECKAIINNLLLSL